MQLLSKLLALSKKLARLKYRISCLMLHESVIAIDQNLGIHMKKIKSICLDKVANLQRIYLAI